IPVRIWRRTSGGAESGDIVKAVCIILVIVSSHIFWKAAACPAVFSKSLISQAKNGAVECWRDGVLAAYAPQLFPDRNFSSPITPSFLYSPSPSPPSIQFHGHGDGFAAADA